MTPSFPTRRSSDLRHERLQKPARVLPLRFTAGAGKSRGVRKNRLINEATRVMHQGNASKLGTFASNCASGLTITKHPDRWSGSWEDNLDRKSTRLNSST